MLMALGAVCTTPEAATRTEPDLTWMPIGPMLCEARVGGTMNPEIEIESAHADEGYVAPDVVRLGTAEGLTAASAGSDGLGDCSSSLC